MSATPKSPAWIADRITSYATSLLNSPLYIVGARRQFLAELARYSRRQFANTREAAAHLGTNRSTLRNAIADAAKDKWQPSDAQRSAIAEMVYLIFTDVNSAPAVEGKKRWQVMRKRFEGAVVRAALNKAPRHNYRMPGQPAAIPYSNRVEAAKMLGVARNVMRRIQQKSEEV